MFLTCFLLVRLKVTAITNICRWWSKYHLINISLFQASATICMVKAILINKSFCFIDIPSFILLISITQKIVYYCIFNA